jgi:hypothetical protein
VAGVAIDAPPDTSDGASVHPDACSAAIGPACGGTLWVADFTRDPTAGDGNCDGVADFHVRSGAALPGMLQAGVWSEPGTPILALDTAPVQNFLTRTIVDVRMRNTQYSASAFGAVAWINVGYDGTYMAPLFVGLALDGGGGQTASLYGKPNPSTAQLITQFTGLDTGFHTIHLDIDPPSLAVTFSVDNSLGLDRNFFKFAAGGNVDKWASVVAYSSDSEFDRFSVEVCP